MNRRIAIAAAALAVSLGALPLMAQAPGGGFGAAEQRPGGPGRGGRGGGPGGPMAVLPGLNQVGLTDAQREQVRSILEQERQSDNPGEKLRQAEEALRAAVLADAPDAQAIEAAKAAVDTARATELDRRVAIMQKIAQILTPAQRQQLVQMPPPPPPRNPYI
jgi:protein CpxP